MGKNETGIQSAAKAGAWQTASRRSVRILFTGVLLTVLLISRAAWLAGKRNESGSVVLEELCIPGLRGSILSMDGKRLAWSERQLRLFWQLPQTHAEAVAVRQRLASLPGLCALLPAAEELSDHLGQRLLLSEVFSGSLDQELLAHVEGGDLFLEGYFIRHVSAADEVIGAVVVDSVSGLELGISGMEKEYDQRLRGRVLRYAKISGSGKLTRLQQSLFSDTGNGENVVIEHRPEE